MNSVEGKVFCHPLRVRILGSLGFRPASVMELSYNLSQPFDKIAYHITVLCDTGYAVPIEGQDPDAIDPLYEPTTRI